MPRHLVHLLIHVEIEWKDNTWDQKEGRLNLRAAKKKCWTIKQWLDETVNNELPMDKLNQKSYRNDLSIDKESKNITRECLFLFLMS